MWLLSGSSSRSVIETRPRGRRTDPGRRYFHDLPGLPSPAGARRLRGRRSTSRGRFKPGEHGFRQLFAARPDLGQDRLAGVSTATMRPVVSRVRTPRRAVIPAHRRGHASWMDRPGQTPSRNRHGGSRMPGLPDSSLPRNGGDVGSRSMTTPVGVVISSLMAAKPQFCPVAALHRACRPCRARFPASRRTRRQGSPGQPASVSASLDRAARPAGETPRLP